MRNVFTSLIVLALIFLCSSLNAQKSFPHDTNYYNTYENLLTARLYVSQKYGNFIFHSSGTADNLEYRGNTNFVTGVGGAYHNISLYLGLGLGFLNHDNDEKGKTKVLDIQLHMFPHNWAIDVLGMNYKNLYAYPKGYGTNIPNTYYRRRDATLSVFGLSAYRVTNSQKFSFNAAIIQNEWQKKSAGALLYGGSIYYNSIKADDSSLIPTKVLSSFTQGPIDKYHFITIAPGVGYAYTLVAAQHLFLMTSVIINADVNFSKDELNNNKNTKTSVEPGLIYKAAAGYNGSIWNVSANWAGSAAWAKEANVAKTNFLPTGTFRLIVAKRIDIKHHN